MDKNQMPPLHMDVPPMSPAPTPLARVLLSDDDLIDNAAGCAQFRPLCSGMDETNESLRECIKLNVCKPLRDRITALTAHSEAVAALVEAAALKRNAIMRDGQHKGFKGDWIAVPAGDFNALRESLSRLAALEDGAKPSGDCGVCGGKDGTHRSNCHV